MRKPPHLASLTILSLLTRRSLGVWALVWFVGGVIFLPLLHQCEPHASVDPSSWAWSRLQARWDTATADALHALSLSTQNGESQPTTDALMVTVRTQELHEHTSHAHDHVHAIPHTHTPETQIPETEHGKGSLWHFGVSITSHSGLPYLRVAPIRIFKHEVVDDIWGEEDIADTSRQPRAPPTLAA